MSRSLIYRESSVAGSFYSRDKLILEREMGMLLEAAPVLKLPRPIRGIIVPHAGYLYSGGVSARAYSQILRTRYRQVVIVGPSHEETFSFCSIYNGLGYRTPFGEIPVDESLSAKLVESSENIQLSDIGHSPSEFAIEVQLPFLQWCLGKFNLVPIVMGEQEESQIKELSRALAQVLPHEGSLLVASSDLSHGYSGSKARLLDQIAIDALSKFDDKMLWREVQEGQTELSGYGPVIAVMRTAKEMGAKDLKVLLHRNSGDITGDTREVVGYLSAVIY